ncbi:MAG: hypothetical protein QGG19_07565 [Alphaproteobacteria bacterium]|jgi:predicted transcriptional regulator|nr:hypothetical protein [Rhodospirillaceae bacterium]MDP6021145.1 hypothetical protein [Alphaproteobacteria bacterium]MDP6253285.1 hypothetical protein [Alphaproteobacteria bacterium]MDP7054207.1 hypothetical protein [Alphaproteobacteria bacterium]MDP7227615.1 hypothetical protein [Alphaproteobacteria bacterium]|tara:strand:- start:673 stop:927 length:255 start_codon:yes stop_codon:yes gene_type:complete
MAQIGAHCTETSVADLTNQNVVYYLPEYNIYTIMSTMTKHRIYHFPVTRNYKLLGSIFIGDMVKYRIKEIESEATATRHYIATA